jgi:hypothetical protein
VLDREQPAVAVPRAPLDDVEEASWSCRVTAPTVPFPTGMRSIEVIGVISAAVPVKKTSSAM